MAAKREVAAVLVAVLLGAPFSVAAAQESPERTYETAHFSLTWTSEEGSSDAPDLSDEDGNGVPDSIERLGAAFESAWQLEVVQMGYRPPPVEGRYPIYIAQGDGSGYTQRAPGGEGVSFPSFIVVPPQRFDPLVSDGSVKAFAAHEFFHAIQIGYNAFSEQWIEEASSTWIETIAAPEAANAYGYLPSFVPASRISLQWSFGAYEYGSFLFVEFLVERYGTDPEPEGIVRELWEAIGVADGSVATTAALEDVLAARGANLESAWAEFLLWRKQLRRFSDGHAYRSFTKPPAALNMPPVTTESCRSTTDLAGDALPPLSGDYHRLKPGPDAPARAVARVTVRGPEGATGFAWLKGRDDAPSLSLLSFEGGIATLDLPFGRHDARSLTLGLGNVSAGPATLEYSVRYPGTGRVTASPPASPQVITFGLGVFISGSVSCGGELAPFSDVEIVATEVVSGETRIQRSRTDAYGRWTWSDAPTATSTYVVSVVDPLLSGATSDAQRVGVAIDVSTIVTPERPVFGESVSVDGMVRPSHPGEEVIVEFRRPSARRWREGGRALMDGDGRYHVSVTLPEIGVWQVRSRVPSTGDLDHLPSVGAIRLVSVRQPE